MIGCVYVFIITHSYLYNHFRKWRFSFSFCFFSFSFPLDVCSLLLFKPSYFLRVCTFYVNFAQQESILGTISTYVGGLKHKIYILCFCMIKNVSEKWWASIIMEVETYAEKDLQSQLLMVSTPNLHRLNSKGPRYLLFSCECEMLLAWSGSVWLWLC